VEAEPHCRVERIPGSGEEELLKNPISAELVPELVESYGKVHSVALTGGEPLLHADFIRALRLNARLYLESNMTLPEEAAKLRRRLSFVAGDFKVREVLHGERRSYEEVREATIASFKVLRSTRRRYTFCKVILPSRFNSEEVLASVEAVARYINMAVLQPVWQHQLAKQELLALQEKLLDIVETRIIPQTHKVLAMR
jgi:organic radical activating enzyme